MSHFDVYGRMALETKLPTTTQNGRYLAQEQAEKFVPEDIISKLQPTKEDVFLDIGCGLGLNLRPMMEMVGEADACDHSNVIEKLKSSEVNWPVTFFAGNFLELEFKKKYTKMLAYSVIPSLPNKDVVYAFVDKILSIMDDTGMALLGDIANIDKKKRFMESKRGEAFQREWEELRAHSSEEESISKFQKPEDIEAVIMDDAFVLDLIKHIRVKGFHAYLVDQPHHLPFGNTREDIMIVGSEYKGIA